MVRCRVAETILDYQDVGLRTPSLFPASFRVRQARGGRREAEHLKRPLQAEEREGCLGVAVAVRYQELASRAAK